MDAVVIGPGSFYTSLMPICLVEGVREALAEVQGPVIYIANLLTEGSGMDGFTAADAARLIEEQIGRPMDVMIYNTAPPSPEVLDRYAAEHKHPMKLGAVDGRAQVVCGRFWLSDIARHDRRRLAYAVWGILAKRLLS
jgi:uncharacterized cofD-like protein